MDRDRVVYDTAHAAGSHRPSIRARILVEPLLYLVEALAETPILPGYPDAHRKSALGIASRRCAAHGFGGHSGTGSSGSIWPKPKSDGAI
jgi:hypothetical protein